MRDNPVPDALLDDAVRVTNTMKKLETLQPEEDREKLGNCTGAVPGTAKPTR